MADVAGNDHAAWMASTTNPAQRRTLFQSAGLESLIQPDTCCEIESLSNLDKGLACWVGNETVET
jgi:hypothetical protein